MYKRQETICIAHDEKPYREELWYTLLKARFVLIWNGWQFYQPIVRNFCRRRGIPHAFVEFGMLPQAKTYTVDRTGFCGESMLCGDLNWVSDDDMKELADRRTILRTEHPPRDDGYVLCCLQLSYDTQIVSHSDWFDMQEVVDHTVEANPDRNVLVRRHPKSRKAPDISRWGGRVSLDDPSQPLMGTVAGASKVVAVSSTCLYEAAAYGVDVEPLSPHPLSGREGPADRDRAVAGAIAMTFPRNGKGLADRLNRVGCAPRKCDA